MIKDALKTLSVIIIAAGIIGFFGIAGAIDAETIGGDPVTNWVIQIVSCAALLGVGVVLRLVSDYIE